LWRERTGIITNPVVHKQLVFGSNNGTLRALDIQTGSTAWQASVGANPFPSSVAVINDILFTGGSNGQVFAFNPETGEQLWKRTVSGSILGFDSHEDNVIIASSSTVQSVSSESGLVNWSTELGVYIRGRQRYVGARQGGSPLTYGNVVLIRLNKSVAALSAADGRVVWETELDTSGLNVEQPGGGMAIADNKVFAASSVLTAIDIETGDVAWKVDSDGGVGFYGNAMVSPVTNGELVFTGTDSLKAVDAQDGSVVWVGGGNPYPGDSIAYDQSADAIYLSAMRRDNNSRTLISLSPSSGTENWSVQLGTAGRFSRDYYEDYVSKPVASDSGVHVACMGELVTVRTSRFELTTPTSPSDPVSAGDATEESPTSEQSTVQAPEEDANEISSEEDSSEYRGLISNNPDTDIGNQLGDMYVLTLVSTALSIFVMLGQAFRRRGE
jgi:outer membrane protein assembly factor BamB